ncbi:MAG TPA: [FeFe] hydrogenase H-cluster radical SAM maturase HydG [Desulfobacterales bacterium]|nr:[FeFe] hydrogenase H-cluster radical SAM maturase HydG [Desulfobacterales bacterium]
MSQINDWIACRIKLDQRDKYLREGKDFINDGEMLDTLKRNVHPDAQAVRDIIQKSLAIETLTPDETAMLLNVADPELVSEMEAAALAVKKKVYDNRIVTFAPLYMSTKCVNNCLYCGFRRDNEAATRGVLSMEEIRKECEILAGKIGHKRLIAVCGEHPESDAEYIAQALQNIYSVKMKTRHGYGQIRRVNVNAAPLPIEDLKMLHDIGIGTYQVFQETYHHETYRKVHPVGTLKSDYPWRLYCMHRALEAGVDDVGIGALFGLYDWKFEVMGLLYHAMELERVFGIGPHTISFPRIEPAENTPFTSSTKYKIGDDDFRKAVVVLRLSVPYTGMILTARENSRIRRELIPLGITQTDASSKIGLGAYSDDRPEQQGKRQQFILGDTRSLDEVIGELARMGYITSFCTAGYRCGRTGKCIMDLLRSGKEGNFCKLNAVITFREWLDDFASESTKALGEEVIAREISEVREKMPQIFDSFMKYYQRTIGGERDLYF